MEINLLSIVVPVYKEEDNIAPFVAEIERVLGQASIRNEIIFCMDPSPDGTKEEILRQIERNKHIRLITFSRRFGQPAATLAGIKNAKGDACVVIDVDLQDPVEVILELLEKYREGYDVVYAKRRKREGETQARLAVAHMAYRLINRLSDVNIPTDTGDFRLISRRVMDELISLNETHGFLRGMVAFVGFRQTFVLYDRKARNAGETKYNPFTGSFKIGFNGMFCYSSKPLYAMLPLGVLLMPAGILIACFVHMTAGLLTFYSGLNAILLGLLGQYIGRIYDEVKDRPMYIIDEIIDGAKTTVELYKEEGAA
jgi:dolichol-phosphate mannosyltransferase